MKKLFEPLTGEEADLLLMLKFFGSFCCSFDCFIFFCSDLLSAGLHQSLLNDYQ